MYKKSPAQKRSCYKMTPKSPMLKAFKKKCSCGGKCPKCKPSMARNYKKGYYGA